MDLTRTELLEIALDVAEAEPTELPPGMASRILGAAVARRPHAVHPAWATPEGELSSHAAYIATASGLSRLLETLTPDEWQQPTQVGGGASVRDLVLHLIGVERYVLGQLARRDPIDAPTAADHFPVLHRAAAADLAGVDDAHVARTWWLEAMELIGACAEVGPDHEIAYHHLAGSVRGMLVIRTFELWTHDDDIRRAIGIPPNELDEARLTLMSSTLMDSLAIGMALSGTTQPGRTVRINLIGAGGGRSFDIALSPGEVPGLPDLTIAASALDLCRLASNRLSADQIELQVDGDRSLLEPVLVGATAFAMD